MDREPLTAISPLDGRYSARTDSLRNIFSEYGLIRFRVLAEVRWVQFLAQEPGVEGLGPLSPVVNDVLKRLAERFGPDDARQVKEIERRTNHDVKAVEYLIAERLGNDADLSRIRPFLHFACTSEDINNIAYALMLRHGTGRRAGAHSFARSLPCSTPWHGIWPMRRCSPEPTASRQAPPPWARSWPTVPGGSSASCSSCARWPHWPR